MEEEKKCLKASSYYLEDVLGLKLDERDKEGKISFLLLNQPPVCDANCRRCFMPKNRRSLGKKDCLTLAESKRVLELSKKHGALCLEISGEGEPTISKNIFQTISYANKLGYLTTLITNGHSLTREQIKQCAESNVTLIFSHYSLNKKKYEQDNNTKGSFDKKMNNLKTAIELYKNSIEIKNGFKIYRLAIHATLQQDNLKDIMEIKDFCHKNNIFFSIAPLAQTGCATEHPEMKLSKTVEINGQKVNISQVPNLLGDNSIIHSHSSARELGREVCGTCYYGLNIGFDGALLFDAHGGYELSNLIGNAKKQSFEEILQKRDKISKILFCNIKGFCPVRDPQWNSFLQKIIGKKIKI